MPFEQLANVIVNNAKQLQRASRDKREIQAEDDRVWQLRETLSRDSAVYAKNRKCCTETVKTPRVRRVSFTR